MVQVLKGNSLETRIARLHELMRASKQSIIDSYYEVLFRSWIYHDSLLEGVAYRKDELDGALTGVETTDTSLIPIFEEIRNHKAAIDLIYELADENSDEELSLAVLKRLVAILAPEEVEGKTVRYRKDSPPHRPYFHDVLEPEKISGEMRKLMSWVNSAETQRSMHPIRIAARAHHEMLHIYPFAKLNGKVARLFMNLILMRSSYIPAIIHSSERQRYYDVLRTSDDATAQLITDALGGNVETSIDYFSQRV